MWTRTLLKTNAQQVLSARWTTAILVVLAYTLLTGGTPTVSLDYLLNGNLSESMLWIAGGSALLTVLFTIFVINPMAVGLARFFMENRMGEAPFATLFGAFHREDYKSVTLAMLWTNVKIFLYYLLLIIPGVIKSYEYYLVPYLLSENPQMSASRAQELSRRIMDGEKINVFVLQLSFLGWGIGLALISAFLTLMLPILSWPLSILASVLLGLYMNATFAEFYAAMREKAFAMNLTDPQELGGFIAY